MFSARFSKIVVITHHAQRRMAERNIDEAILNDLIDTGDVRHKDETRLWIAKSYSDRADNLLCAVAVIDAQLVVKTVMHHFSWNIDT